MVHKCVHLLQTLSNSGRMHESLLSDIGERVESVLPQLGEGDQIALREKLHELREALSRSGTHTGYMA